MRGIQPEPFDLDAFAKAMSQPWTCYLCRRVFTPQPDDPDSLPFAIQTQDIPATGKKKKVGDVCVDCYNLRRKE